MQEDTSSASSSRELSEGGSFLKGVPGHYATLCLGVTALGASLAAYFPSLDLIAMIDVPLNFMLFLACAFIGLGTRERRGLAIVGVLLATAGLFISALHLVTAHDHPWVL